MRALHSILSALENQKTLDTRTNTVLIPEILEELPRLMDLAVQISEKRERGLTLNTKMTPK